MKIGLAGLPMSGKTTIFNLATRANAQIRDYLQQTDEVNTGIIKVPDSRIDALTEIYKPKKKTYATVEFTDIPGISKENASFSSKTLAHIRTADALLLVVRLFQDEGVPHIRNAVDPATDLEELGLEFIIADLELVTNKIERLRKELKAGRRPELSRELDLQERLRETLEANRFLSELNLSEEDSLLIRGYRFLTEKPILVVGNCSDDQFSATDDPMVAALEKACTARGWQHMRISAKTEMEIANLSPEEEAVFLSEFGISEPSRNRLIREAYRILNYCSFLTVGEDEVRAWAIQNATTALKAAGKIHSDIERGFIRAEVVAYDDFMKHGSMAAVKQVGLARLEGKEYLVQDGDIINFRFNV